MACPNCGADTVSGQKFCFECGTELAVACSNCEAPLPAGAKFCGECGTPTGEAITATASPSAAAPAPDVAEPTAERRLVSVLFADLVGFTATSEHRDPEEVREFLTRYSELATDTIQRYGGTVDKFIGDGVMAIWGTPTAFEDDAERAVRAALDLAPDVETLGNEFGVPGLSVRAGIATGEAAVTLDAGSHGMVAGDLVNTASRLEAAAEPGTVLVNEATQLATNEAISYEPAGDLTLKGKTQPVAVWQPLQVVAMRGGAGRASGLEAPFVGRVAELQLLKDLFQATVRDERAHLVSVQGIPGIGKSRLIWEFEKYLDGLADLFYWHQGRSPAYGEGVTFWALGEMVRRRAGIAENDDHFFTTLQLDAIVDEFVPKEDRRWISTALQVLLGVSDSPGVERDELFAAWRTFFQHLSSQAPAVMVFEDLQWADHGTLDFVESLLEWSRDYPIFVVTLARPELLDRRENWGAGQRGFTGLHLEPLSHPEIEELLTGLAPGLPDDLVTGIVERSEGVPLYAVETVRMLIGQGHLVPEGDGYVLTGDLPELAVPETLHALVAARLDTLDRDDRQLLQKASVLGQTFPAKGLASLAGLSPGEVEQRLELLVRREILSIEADPRSPERGQYKFVQGVIKEVAYSSLGRAERGSLHIQVAELLEEQGDDELAGVIASHLVDAYHAVPQAERADDLTRRTLEALESAAIRAGTLGSHAQAVAHLEQAMDVSVEAVEQADLQERAGSSAVLAGLNEVARSHFANALEHARRRSDRQAIARSAAGLGGVLLMESQVDEAIELLDSVRSEIEGMEATTDSVVLHAQLGRAHAFHENGLEAMTEIEKALTEAARLDLIEVVMDALITKAWALTLLGREREAEAVTEGAMSFSARHGLTRSDLRARNNIAAYSSWTEPVWTLGIVQDGFEMARKSGDMDNVGVLGSKAAWSAIQTGAWDLAMDIIDELREETHSWFVRNQVGFSLAELLAKRGEIEAAEEVLEEMRLELEASTSPQDRVGSLWTYGWVALASGDPTSAREYALQVFELSDQAQWVAVAHTIGIHAAIWQGEASVVSDAIKLAEEVRLDTPRLEASILSGKAAVAALGGDQETATQLFVKAADIFREVGVPFDLALSQLACASLLESDHEAGRDAAEEAREIFTELGAKPFLERLDEVARA